MGLLSEENDDVPNGARTDGTPHSILGERRQIRSTNIKILNPLSNGCRCAIRFGDDERWLLDPAVAVAVAVAVAGAAVQFGDVRDGCIPADRRRSRRSSSIQI